MDWQFVILSGPSCVGKGPLCEALARFHPELHSRLHRLVLFNSRPPRPGEVEGVDYFFRPRKEIENLRGKKGYLVVEARADIHALDLSQIKKMRGSIPFFEGNPFVARQIMNSDLLKNLNTLSVFLSPLSRKEIEFLKRPERGISLPDFISNLMERKLLRRTERQKGKLALSDLKDIQVRAKSAYKEMGEARHFDYVLPNHDGEDSENWNAFYYPIGDAREVLSTFVCLLSGSESVTRPGGQARKRGRPSDLAEKWEKSLPG